LLKAAVLWLRADLRDAAVAANRGHISTYSERLEPAVVMGAEIFACVRG
jgi:hypothetical protein